MHSFRAVSVKAAAHVRLLVAAFFLLVGSALAQGMHMTSLVVSSLVVDLPHGGCMLHVSKDGTASLSYGSMPRWIEITRNTFDFDKLVIALRSRASSATGDALPLRTGGSFSLPGDGGVVRFIQDEAFVRALLQRAWRARVAPKTAQEKEDARWVAKACPLP